MFTVPTPSILPDLSSLKIDSDAVLRQLGATGGQSIGARERFIARMVLSRAGILCAPRGVFRVFAAMRSEAGYVLNDADLCLESPNLLSLWGEELEYVAMLAVTVGIEIEESAAQLGTNGDVLGEVMMDAAGSVAVESAADLMSVAIGSFAAKAGLKTSLRYSPGYGDLSLDLQKDFERLLAMEQSLGISLLRGEILQPYKSITAFVGLRKVAFPIPSDRACETCSLKNNCDRRSCRHGKEQE